MIFQITMQETRETWSLLFCGPYSFTSLSNYSEKIKKIRIIASDII